MKKKGAFIAVLLAGVMSLGVSAAGCKKKDDGNDVGHVHSWSNYVSNGEAGHYRETTCKGHDPIKEQVSAHEYDGADDADCNKCGYEREVGGEVVPVTSVSISGNATVQAGKVIALTATVTPATATEKTVVWEIAEGAAYAYIDSATGVLKGLAAGTVKVKATAGGVSSMKEITVTPASSTDIPVTYVSLSQSSAELTVGGSDIKLKATVSPAEATDKTVIWSSDNTGVATVADGVVHAVAEGTANITVVTEDGGYKAVCAVTVVAASSPIVPPPVTPAAKYTVTFINGGVTVDTQTVESGGIVAAPQVSKEGSYFGGWFEDAAGSGTAFDFTKGITANKTLYVKWIELDAKITYSYAGYETAAFEWTDTNASAASVQYKLSSDSTYTDVDGELVRDIGGNSVRVDVLGLKGGETYDFKINTSAGAEIKINAMAINAYDRSGYAHFNYSDGVGAYNDDGTLKDNALVIYVTEQNKNTVMDEICAENTDVPMFQIPGSDWKNKNASGIGWWLNNNQYTSSNAGSKKNKVPSNTYDATNGGKLSFKAVNRPIVIRFIGTVTTPEGCTAYNDTKEGGGVGDNGHMARLKNLKNITLEGVGEDAQIKGWGFHFVIGTDATNGQGTSFEVRNLTFNEYPEDAIGMEGQQSGGKITAGVERCWVHNNTFLPGRCDSPAESDKKEGDGSCDFKRGQYFTCSYNYFEYCHKTNLIGSADDSLQYNLTYHHNMWYQCGSRIPLARQANIHFYNNYVCYDSTETSTPYSHIAKPAGSYVHSLRANCYLFSEGNYYEGSKNITDGKSGGAGKAWNNMYYANFSTNTLVEASTREQKVSNNCAYNGTDYSSFDTNPALFYYDAQNKRSNCSITDPVTARKEVIENVGVQGFSPRVKTDMLSSKPATALSVPSGGLTIDLSKASAGGNVNGVYFINAKNSSGVAKGKGQLAMFTLAERADITVNVTGSGDSIGELLRSDGMVVAGKFTSFTGTLEAGTYFIASGQKDKDASITALSFKSGVTDAEKVQNVINYIDEIGVVEFTEICKNRIELAYAAYNALSDTLKSQVTNANKLTSAVTSYNSLAAAPVIELISAIGTVNEDSGLKISAARAAYNSLTSAQAALVTNYATLVAAEKAYENFEVDGINKQIASLAAPSAATTEAEIRDLLDRYETVAQMYSDLGDEQKEGVVGYNKVTAGITALQNALKPYEVKAMIAAIPAETASDFYTQVGKLKAAYEALDAQQKTLITATEKAAYDAAMAKYTEYLNQAKVAIFDKNHTDLATKAGFTIKGTVGYKGTSQTYTYNGVEYNSPLKIQSSNTILFKTETKMKVTIFLHSGGGQKLLIDGKEYTADGGFITAEIDAGDHVIGRSGEAWLCYVELVPAA